MKSKIVIMVLSLFILLFSFGMYLESASDVEEIRKKCEDYCNKYTNEYYRWVCIDGCLAGATF